MLKLINKQNVKLYVESFTCSEIIYEHKNGCRFLPDTKKKGLKIRKKKNRKKNETFWNKFSVIKSHRLSQIFCLTSDKHTCSKTLL